MKEDDARLTPNEEEELIGAVIRRTSGSACRRAEELLAEIGPSRSVSDPPSGSLAAARDLAATPGLPVTPDDSAPTGRLAPAPDSADLALLEAHLDHCAACAALARSLAVARDTLPSFVAFDPGPSFTATVLAATSRAEAEEFRHVWLKPDATYVGNRIAALWHAWLARPRFAFEVAYAATILILVIVGNPVSRLQAASERSVTAAAAGLDRAREVWPIAIARVAPSIEVPASVRALGGVTQSLMAERRAARGGLADAWDRVLAQWSVAWDWMAGMASDVAARVSETLTNIRTAASQWFNRTRSEPRASAVR